jgi:hypothetical protein
MCEDTLWRSSTPCSHVGRAPAPIAWSRGAARRNRPVCCGRRSRGHHQVVEVETGKGADALEPPAAARGSDCRRPQTQGAVVVSKLDRLSRGVHFISGRSAQAVRRRRVCGRLYPTREQHVVVSAPADRGGMSITSAQSVHLSMESASAILPRSRTELLNCREIAR